MLSRPCSIYLLLLLLYTLHPFAAAICYFPDGTSANQDTPCSGGTSDGYSTCCGQGYACLSNHICMATGEEITKAGASLYVRGSCTDKNFNSANCPLFCASPGIDNEAGGMGIGKCEGTQDVYYCLNSQKSSVNCAAKQNVLSFQGAPTALTTIGYTSMTSSKTTSTTSTSTTSTRTTTSSSRSTTSSTASSTTPLAAASTAPSTVSNGSSDPKSQSNNTVAIGVGVGVGLGILAIVLVVIYLLRRRWKKRALAGTNGYQPPVHPQQQSAIPPLYDKHNQPQTTQPLHEMETTQQLYEMETRGERWELQS